ncbi:hypothetical protein KC19_VG182400 [Ceratodon purpureus]|uniref:Uncharacterized protein n=1 Tax=Ceratodon purpureus TaxID=3225 RepID=A0A8T0HRR8_CERPU|nr:hypothetical protein KC19_VG182400 [Ceratodon purpureus]
MLDNMVVPLPNGDVDLYMLLQAVTLIDGRFETEASGNATLETVSKIGSTGVTYISRRGFFGLPSYCTLKNGPFCCLCPSFWLQTIGIGLS